MPQFSAKSLERLKTCDHQIQMVFNEVIKERECIVICGARTLAEQQAAFKGGFSKLDGINKKSKHQVSKEQPLSLAIDVLPPKRVNGKITIDWNDVKGHTDFANFVLKKAAELNVKLVWGGNWKTFKDRPHYQLEG